MYPYILVMMQVMIDAASASTYTAQARTRVTIEYSIALVMVLSLVVILVCRYGCRGHGPKPSIGLGVSPLVSTRWLPVPLPCDDSSSAPITMQAFISNSMGIYRGAQAIALSILCGVYR